MTTAKATPRPKPTKPARKTTAAKNERLRLRVHYPLGAGEGEMGLRTDTDWDATLAPAAVDAARTCFEFDVPFAGPFLYFKPVLLQGEAVVWAQGENLLALKNGGQASAVGRDVYPHFFDDTACSVCSLQTLASADGTREHSLRVFYPPGYAENTEARYPVLYMQDGQNLFFPDEAFAGHHWMIDETLRILDSMNLVRKAIVVGVYPRDRMADYTKPGYEDYGRYLVEEVKPWIDAHYRTLTGPEHTAVMGSSLGGVVSFYLAWQYPEVFGYAGCLSSTFTYRDDLMERVASEPRRPVKLYLDSGWPRDNFEVTRTMRNLLAERGYREGEDLRYLAFPRAKHNEDAWAMRAHVPIQFFFGE
jgi:predicted alpha/beta superfamily hydrolase